MSHPSLTRPHVGVSFAFALLFFICSSCASTTATTTPPANNNTNTGCGTGILCATINGVSYVAESYNAAGDPIQDKSAGSFAKLEQPWNGFAFHITINGDKAPHPQQSIEIMMTSNSTPTVGTAYDINNSTVGIELDYRKFDATDLVFYDWRAHRSNAGSSGTVTLTKFDPTTNLISGTFSFTGVEDAPNSTHDNTTASITNGSFTDLPITR